MTYNLGDHGGDASAEIRGRDLAELLTSAGAALTAIVTEPDLIAERTCRTIELTAESPEELLVSLLNALLFLFETESLLFRRIDARVEGLMVSAVGFGETYDPGRHPIKAVPKAATYHGLAIASTDAGLEARIVFDL